jgi:hypothetical protein
MQCHVTYGLDVRQELQNVLEVDDLAIVLNSKHRPRCIIEFISQSLQLLKLEESRRNTLVIPFLGYLNLLKFPILNKEFSKVIPGCFLFFCFGYFISFQVIG